jgi:hypothetical protein
MAAMHTGIGIFEWVFWGIAIVAMFLALWKSERLSSASGPGVHVRPSGLFFLWFLAVAGGIAGFISSAIALRIGEG